MPRTDDTCFDSSNSSNVLVRPATVAILFPGLINLVMLESSLTTSSSTSRTQLRINFDDGNMNDNASSSGGGGGVGRRRVGRETHY